MSQSQSKSSDAASQGTTSPSASWLDRVVSETEQGRTAAQQGLVKQTIIEIFGKSPQLRSSTISADLEGLIEQRIAAIEQTVSTQLDKVMHEPKFQTLEANWRGLNQLVVNTRLSKELRIKVLDVSRRELERDLGVGGAKEKSYQDSTLFNKLHDQEYGTPGGTPYGALIGAFEFGSDEHDVALLAKISKVAAVSHAPFIAAASPTMFSWENYTRIQGGNALYKLVEGDEHVHWNRFRSNPDSRYVGLVLPKYLARTPYRRKADTPEFTFDENRTEADKPSFLWGNAAFVFGQILTKAFADHGWCTAIRGQENGGDIQLPYASGGKHTAGTGPTEVIVTHAQERELSAMGFLSLCQIKGTSEAVFFSGQSCQLPTAYYDNETQESADLSARLPYIFAVSRFAHHLKAMLYRKIGSPMGRDQIQEYLHKWIIRFVLDKANPTLDEMAKFPLASARVSVEPVPGKAGEFRAVMELQPHIQLERIDVAMRLVSNVPKDVVKK